MYTTGRSNQSGSIAIFAIIAVILAAGVIGGIYALQKRGEVARTSTPNSQNVATTNDQDQKTDQQKADDAKKQAEAQQKADADKKAAADKQAAAQKQAQADAEKQKQQAAADQKAAQDKAAQDAQKQTASATPQAADKLPTTGPEDFMPQVVVGAIMVAVTLAYLKSYRHRYGSILR